MARLRRRSVIHAARSYESSDSAQCKKGRRYLLIFIWSLRHRKTEPT